jgi:hypothetical protein
MDPGEDDEFRIGLGRRNAQGQGIADHVGDLLHLGPLIVMGQQNAAPLCEKGANLPCNASVFIGPLPPVEARFYTRGAINSRTKAPRPPMNPLRPPPRTAPLPVTGSPAGRFFSSSPPRPYTP